MKGKNMSMAYKKYGKLFGVNIPPKIEWKLTLDFIDSVEKIGCVDNTNKFLIMQELIQLAQPVGLDREALNVLTENIFSELKRQLATKADGSVITARDLWEIRDDRIDKVSLGCVYEDDQLYVIDAILLRAKGVPIEKSDLYAFAHFIYQEFARQAIWLKEKSVCKIWHNYHTIQTPLDNIMKWYDYGGSEMYGFVHLKYRQKVDS
jgi:hypothetical protein